MTLVAPLRATLEGLPRSCVLETNNFVLAKKFCTENRFICNVLDKNLYAPMRLRIPYAPKVLRKPYAVNLRRDLMRNLMRKPYAEP